MTSPEVTRPRTLEYNLTEEEIQRAHLIAARSKLWTPELEKLLRRWRTQIGRRQIGHRRSERCANMMYYVLGIPTAVLGAIASTGVIATFQQCADSPDSVRCIAEEWIRFIMGLLGLLAVIMAATTTFLDLGGTREKHKTAVDSYSELVHEIDMLLRLPIHMREDPIATVQSIRDRFDDVSKSSPSISSSYDAALGWNVDGAAGDYVVGSGGAEPFRARLIPHMLSQHVLGRTHPQTSDTPRPDASQLTKVLLDEIDEQTKKVIEARRRIAASNDYDTDDEDKEVTIAFDPDRVRPGDLNIDPMRREMEASLAKALEFELERLFSSGLESARQPGVVSEEKDKDKIPD